MEELITIHSFIVKIWLEDQVEESNHVTWRGRITHVPSGKRRYITSLEGVPEFITPYLKQMGVTFNAP